MIIRIHFKSGHTIDISGVKSYQTGYDKYPISTCENGVLTNVSKRGDSYRAPELDHFSITMQKNRRLRHEITDISEIICIEDITKS